MEVLLDDGYLGLRRDHPGQAVALPRKANKISPPEVHEARRRARHQHSSKRITVEHPLADHKHWKQLTRWTHRRDVLPATYQAIVGLVSDRTATA
ncbi:transposase [Streptomyces sp. NBC_00654]|nr:transposase [Streptomyces sp. NBC_00654]